MLIGDAYACEITTDEGIYLDETTHIKSVFDANFYLYSYLSIACFFSCIGGPLPLCRICSGCVHCVGVFAHLAVILYTWIVRFRWAKDCFVTDGYTPDVERIPELEQDGIFLKKMFIAQCVLYCVYTISANVG